MRFEPDTDTFRHLPLLSRLAALPMPAVEPRHYPSDVPIDGWPFWQLSIGKGEDRCPVRSDAANRTNAASNEPLRESNQSRRPLLPKTKPADKPNHVVRIRNC